MLHLYWEFCLSAWGMEMLIGWSGDEEHAVWCQSPKTEGACTSHQVGNQDVQI